MIISVLILIFKKDRNYDKGKIFTLLLLGLSGVLPILLSWKQHRFYLIGVLPFFALMFGLILKDSAEKIIKKINSLKIDIIKISTFMLFVFAFVIIIVNHNEICRDKELLTDISEISKIANDSKVLSVTEQNYNNWVLHAYFMRFYDITLTTKDTCSFLIAYKDEKINNSTYKPLEINLKFFKIYERKE